MYFHPIRGVLMACLLCALVAGRTTFHKPRLGRGRRDLLLTIQPLPQGNNPLRCPPDHNSESTQVKLSQGQGVVISAQTHNLGGHQSAKAVSKGHKASPTDPIVRCYAKVEPYKNEQNNRCANDQQTFKEKENKNKNNLMEAEEVETKWPGRFFRKPHKRRKKDEKSSQDSKKSKVNYETFKELTLKNAPVEPESKKIPMTKEELDQVKLVRQKIWERNEQKGRDLFAKIPEKKLSENSKRGSPNQQPATTEASNVVQNTPAGNNSTTEPPPQPPEVPPKELEENEAELEEKLPDAFDELSPQETRRNIPVELHSENSQASIENVNNALGKILTELDTLKSETPTINAPGGHSMKHEGLVCNLTGSWDSEVAGARFDLSIEATGRLHVRVADKVPACPKPLFNERWLISGEAPFHAYGPFIVKAYFKPQRRIGIFVGECRTCEGVEVITGEWILAHEARDCMDVIMSRESILDVWRRDHIRQLQTRKLEQLLKKRNSKNKNHCSNPLSPDAALENHLHIKKQ